MNNQQRKGCPLLTRALGLIILVVIFNTATLISSPVQAADTGPSLHNINCVFNWAQTFKPELFSPPVSGFRFFLPYTYRYYPGTDAYLVASSADNHVYYLGPGIGLQDAQDMGDKPALLAESGCGPRPYPIIFVHGIASSADTWISYRNYLIKNSGRIFGGKPAYNPSTKTVNINCPANLSRIQQCTGGAGDFYTLNFSDNQGLPLDVQGGELAAIIKAVLAANPGKTKVLLVTHSMGGLAAREYLQGLARESDSETTISYQDDVAKLITIGALHQGSFWAEECRNHFDILDISGNVGVCSLLSLDIDPNSVAVEDLQPDSSALNVLNDLANHPLPSNISYVSIIGTGQPTLTGLVDFEDGDGIVSDISQDLTVLTGNLPQQKSVKIDIPFRECGNKIDISPIGNIGQTHTCETTDMGIAAEVLKNLQ